MEIVQYYAASWGLLLLALIILGKFPPTFLPGSFLKHLAFRQVRYVASTNTTWFDIIFMAIYFIGNVILLCIQTNSWTDFANRTGTLSLINAVPLSLGERISILPMGTGLGIDKYALFHRYVGLIVFLETLAHAVAVAIAQKPDFITQSTITGLLGSIFFIIMMLSCLVLFIGRFYNVFASTHPILALGTYISIYLHIVGRHWKSNGVYIVIGFAIFGLNHAARFACIAYRNFDLDYRNLRLTSLVVVQNMTYNDTEREMQISMPDAMYLHIRPTRPWRFRGGQFVYLRFVDLDYSSILQNHPFYISWWYKNSEGDDIGVCIAEKRRGLTEKLSTIDDKAKKKVLIEGPYGKRLRLDKYETILLFATGIGITGLISMVAELFKSPERSPVNLRRIALFWELDYIRKFIRSAA
ncbi:uncharacterized protein Z519_12719 [Cladophialophora bantiana CBS 173.52]|uniref:FAD-binding FR-type domain-containing protein n=1 Tax=Cladophialophora bantiana (strain ATCC 10958 / CBS 173.52 / CDC B-1940 / NIH 8579) TaxID=1442370 RepID=A0A0D2HQD6_CLAB1|nr:uncharacterized protein Z519_12719 [Cladophialophora bantiana CBS 173.52]KIW86664.1 hypothetical protein Z519_12719 [Cladophialophora bantiana CBS 173.52]